MITRGVVSLADSDTMMQALQVKGVGGLPLESVEHWEPYGFTATPHEGAEALLLAAGGRVGHKVAVAVADRRYRPRELKAGEVAMFNSAGDLFIFRDGRLCELTVGTKVTITAPEVVVAASTKVTLDTPLVDIPNGDLRIKGMSVYHHAHPNTGEPVHP